MRKPKRKYKHGQLLFRPSRNSLYVIESSRYLEYTKRQEARHKWLYTCKPLSNDDREQVSYYENRIDDEMKPASNNILLSEALFNTRPTKETI